MNEDMEKMLQEAPAPTLTLEPFAEEKEEPAVVEKEEAVQPVDDKENHEFPNGAAVWRKLPEEDRRFFRISSGQRPDKGSWRDRQRADRRCERIKEHRGR